MHVGIAGFVLVQFDGVNGEVRHEHRVPALVAGQDDDSNVAFGELPNLVDFADQSRQGIFFRFVGHAFNGVSWAGCLLRSCAALVQQRVRSTGKTRTDGTAPRWATGSAVWVTRR